LATLVENEVAHAQKTTGAIYYYFEVVFVHSTLAANDWQTQQNCWPVSSFTIQLGGDILYIQLKRRDINGWNTALYTSTINTRA
jgi:hypothetical protein